MSGESEAALAPAVHPVNERRQPLPGRYTGPSAHTSTGLSMSVPYCSSGQELCSWLGRFAGASPTRMG